MVEKLKDFETEPGFNFFSKSVKTKIQWTGKRDFRTSLKIPINRTFWTTRLYPIRILSITSNILGLPVSESASGPGVLVQILGYRLKCHYRLTVKRSKFLVSLAMFKTTNLVKFAKNKELGKDRLWSSLVTNGVICACCYEAFYGRSNFTPLSVAWLYACNYAARWLCWCEIRPNKCFITLATEFMAVSHALRP